MSALAEALVAAQRRSLATLEKAYVAGLIEPEPMIEAMEACGITDAVDRAFLIASLDVLKEWGVTAPTMTERVARENGEPKKATEGQVSYIIDLLKKGSHGPLAEQDSRCHFDLTGEDEERDARDRLGAAESPREGTEA